MLLPVKAAVFRPRPQGPALAMADSPHPMSHIALQQFFALGGQ
jgi:hypothetical protein